jgi:hypothetical protein
MCLPVLKLYYIVLNINFLEIFGSFGGLQLEDKANDIDFIESFLKVDTAILFSVIYFCFILFQ